MLGEVHKAFNSTQLCLIMYASRIFQGCLKECSEYFFNSALRMISEMYKYKEGDLLHLPVSTRFKESSRILQEESTKL